jgi:hypothetical protein
MPLKMMSFNRCKQKSQQEQRKQNLPIVLTLAEGLANAAGTEALRGPAPLFILRAGMWGEVGDVGDLPSEVLGLAERFSGCATSSCNDHQNMSCDKERLVTNV